jgi:hypothetical protein
MYGIETIQKLNEQAATAHKLRTTLDVLRTGRVDDQDIVSLHTNEKAAESRDKNQNDIMENAV